MTKCLFFKCPLYLFRAALCKHMFVLQKDTLFIQQNDLDRNKTNTLSKLF
jgi:hypothetical protein